MTARAKTGSAMSSKQLAHTVISGRQVTFRISWGEHITGYLCGMDDFHWMVVSPTGHKSLVHKGSAAVVELSDTSTYDDEDHREELEKVVGPFRQWVEENIFGRTVSPASEEKLSA